AANDRGDVVAIDVRGAILRASASDSFHVVRKGEDQGKRLSAISRVSDCEFVAAGQAGTIVASSDGGATWTTESSGTAEDLAGVAAPPGGGVWALGTRGTLVRRNP